MFLVLYCIFIFILIGEVAQWDREYDQAEVSEF